MPQLGVGEIARVELSEVEMGLSEPKPGEFNDVSATNLIKFDDLNPFTYTERLIKIKNHWYALFSRILAYLCR